MPKKKKPIGKKKRQSLKNPTRNQRKSPRKPKQSRRRELLRPRKRPPRRPRPKTKTLRGKTPRRNSRLILNQLKVVKPKPRKTKRRLKISKSLLKMKRQRS